MSTHLVVPDFHARHRQAAAVQGDAVAVRFGAVGAAVGAGVKYGKGFNICKWMGQECAAMISTLSSSPAAAASHIVPPTITSWGLDDTLVQMLSETLLAAQQPVISTYLLKVLQKHTAGSD